MNLRFAGIPIDDPNFGYTQARIEFELVIRLVIGTTNLNNDRWCSFEILVLVDVKPVPYRATRLPCTLAARWRQEDLTVIFRMMLTVHCASVPTDVDESDLGWAWFATPKVGGMMNGGRPPGERPDSA